MIIEQAPDKKLEGTFRDIREKLTSGHSFAEALSYHPHYFPDLYVNMVKAGEASGSLDMVLERLADYLQRQAQIKNKVVAALAYPVVMIIVGVITAVSLTFMTLQFGQVLYAELALIVVFIGFLKYRGSRTVETGKV